MVGASRDDLFSYAVGEHVAPFEAARLAREGEEAVAARLGMSVTQLYERMRAYDHRIDRVCEAVVELEPYALLLELERAQTAVEERGLELDEAILERLFALRDEETGERREAVNTLLFHILAGGRCEVEAAAERLHLLWGLEHTARWLNARGL